MISVFGFTAFVPKAPFRRSAVMVMTDQCAGAAEGQHCSSSRSVYPYQYELYQYDLCIACSFEDDANKRNKFTRAGCRSAVDLRAADYQKHKKDQELSRSAGKLPGVWGSMHSTCAASSHMSQTIQQALKDQAELKEKVKGMPEQIDELAELKEKVKGMQEQIDELAELKEKVKGMQEQ